MAIRTPRRRPLCAALYGIIALVSVAPLANADPSNSDNFELIADTTAPASADARVHALVDEAARTNPRAGTFARARARIEARTDADAREGGHWMLSASAGVMTGRDMPVADMYEAEVMHTLPNLRARTAARDVAEASLARASCEEALWQESLRAQILTLSVALEENRLLREANAQSLALAEQLQRFSAGAARVGASAEAGTIGAHRSMIALQSEARTLAARQESLLTQLEAIVDLDPKLRDPALGWATWAWEVSPERVAPSRAETTDASAVLAHYSANEVSAEASRTRANGRAQWSVGAMYALAPMTMGHTLEDMHEVMAMASVTLPKPKATAAQEAALQADRELLVSEAVLAQRLSDARARELRVQAQGIQELLSLLEDSLPELLAASEQRVARALRFDGAGVDEAVATLQARVDLETQRIGLRAERARIAVALDVLFPGALSANARDLSACASTTIGGAQ